MHDYTQSMQFRLAPQGAYLTLTNGTMAHATGLTKDSACESITGEALERPCHIKQLGHLIDELIEGSSLARTYSL